MFITQHYTTWYETKKNDDFEAKGMLVVSGRKHIIYYKREIESLILQLPKDKQFDVVCAFTKFNDKSDSYNEKDQSINGIYASDPVKDFLENKRVKLIIVADKLQTGFDAPQLGIMYIDKTLNGANAVQTIGRLSRIAKGKTGVSVVDFVNSNKHIKDTFSKYILSESKKSQNTDIVENENNIIISLVNELMGNEFSNEALEFARGIWMIGSRKKTSNSNNDKIKIEKLPETTNRISPSTVNMKNSSSVNMKDSSSVNMKDFSSVNMKDSSSVNSTSTPTVNQINPFDLLPKVSISANSNKNIKTNNAINIVQNTPKMESINSIDNAEPIQKLDPNWKEKLPYKIKEEKNLDNKINEGDVSERRKAPMLIEKLRDQGFTSPWGTNVVLKKRKNDEVLGPNKKRKTENVFVPVVNVRKKN